MTSMESSLPVPAEYTATGTVTASNPRRPNGPAIRARTGAPPVVGSLSCGPGSLVAGSRVVQLGTR